MLGGRARKAPVYFVLNGSKHCAVQQGLPTCSCSCSCSHSCWRCRCWLPPWQAAQLLGVPVRCLVLSSQVRATAHERANKNCAAGVVGGSPSPRKTVQHRKCSWVGWSSKRVNHLAAGLRSYRNQVRGIGRPPRRLGKGRPARPAGPSGEEGFLQRCSVSQFPSSCWLQAVGERSVTMHAQLSVRMSLGGGAKCASSQASPSGSRATAGGWQQGSKRQGRVGNDEGSGQLAVGGGQRRQQPAGGGTAPEGGWCRTAADMGIQQQ